MGSLPRDKAGVGSAMNDTTRQMGGALGVAVLGSVLATSFRPGITNRLSGLGLPADIVATARESIGGAIAAAARVPGALGDQVAALARTEFVRGVNVALLVAAAIVLVAGAVVFAFLPARAG